MMEIEGTEKIEQPKPLSLLASEEFGSEFHGEVKEPEETDPKASDEGSEGEEGSEEGPEGGEGSKEGSEGEEGEGEEGSEGGDEETISSFSELIAQQEWDPEWANTLTVPVKVDGTESEATLGDLVKSYQFTASAEERLEKVKAKVKASNDEIAQKSEVLNSQYAAVGELINQTLVILDKDSKAVDWDVLRKDDPAEYAAKKTEFKERREEIDRLIQGAATSYQQGMVEQQGKLREQQIEFLQQEQVKLLAKIPEWKDDEKAKAGKAKIVAYMKSQGFAEQEMSLFDHRAILIAQKAMLYDESQTKNKVLKKKFAKAPKTLKPGATKPANQISKEKVNKARQRLQDSGSIDDAVALLQARRA